MTFRNLVSLAKCSGSAAFLSATLLSASPAHAVVSQMPLFVGGGNVPGNLALVPSVEYPTVISQANLGDYSHSKNYYGYFDSYKCYKYVEESINHILYGTISAAQGAGYFDPVRKSSNKNCSISDEWSGNYLNWALTQTIDPFRKALTGGYRAVDTTTDTILEKALRENRTNYYPDRTIENNTSNYAPYSSGIRIQLTQTTGSNLSEPVKNFQRNKTFKVITKSGSNWNQTNKHFTVRVRVCKAGLLEDNCVKYGNYYKPEGLLQRYSDVIRYSAFSYLASNQQERGHNGGVLRAQQAFIGPMHSTLANPNLHDNPNKEWDPKTGVFITNPYNATEGNSGVINYINKFGELSGQLKYWDNVSELYYTAIRYFKNQGQYPIYSNTLKDNNAIIDRLKDKFPAIETWNDPIIYACQKNIILGIGDARTASDHDIPEKGTDSTDIPMWTKRVFDMEGISTSTSSQFTFNSNSAHIAGLAYYANVSDIRTDKPGRQSISTHWIDVIEDGYVYGMKDNPYMLATKYGGLKVSDAYDPSKATAPAAGLWASQNKTISVNRTFSGGDKYITPTVQQVIPDNYYEASQAEKMVESLEKAFSTIVSEVQLSLSSLASNSTRLDTDTALYQASMNSRYWSGDLVAKAIDPTTGLPLKDISWSAAEKLSRMAPSSRKIYTSKSLVEAGGVKRSTQAVAFTWDKLDKAQRDALKDLNETDTDGKNRVEYLRGDRSNEITDNNQSLPFRQRGGLLGDIINSDPQLVSKQNFGYNRLRGHTDFVSAATSYSAFQTSKARRPEMLVFGANDGMLHGLKASTKAGEDGGTEIFAFIPNSIFHKLIKLSEPKYAHEYFVDGAPRVADAWSSKWGAWKTLVIGSTGAGGNSIFALDVSNPNSINENSFLWEFSHADMGYTIGQPAVVALPNGKFAVVVTSGYHNEAKQNAKVWFLDVADGSVMHTIEIKTTGSLGAPLLTDAGGDMMADRLYVADTAGNLWAYDLERNLSQSKSRTGTSPLFTATTKDAANKVIAQPITAPLTASINTKGEHIILFGTGSFLWVGDNEVPTAAPIQSFYGILDTAKTVSASNLLTQTISEHTLASGLKVRTLSDNEMKNHLGWKVDLNKENGERVVARALPRGNNLIFTTMTPSNDPCASGGTSWLMAVDLKSGGQLKKLYFDTNKDLKLDKADYITINGKDVPVSGLQEIDGVVKGAAPLLGWLCYVNSSGVLKCIHVGDPVITQRYSWQEVR